MNRKKSSPSLDLMLLAEAAKVDASTFTLTMPLYVLLGEAVDVARFCEHHWRAETDRKGGTIVKPGLELAGKSLLSRVIADEIVVLQDLVQKAQTAYLLAIAPPSEGIDRAVYVLDELASALEWLCDDGVQDEKDAKLAAIVEAHRNDSESEDALASELADYVGLADELRGELEEIGAFDSGIIDEARSLVIALRERSALRTRGRNGTASGLLVKRNQLAALLVQRIGRVRAAARYIFRHHEAIVKQVTSAYQRRRRAAARRRANNNAAAPEPPVPPSVLDSGLPSPSA